MADPGTVTSRLLWVLRHAKAVDHAPRGGTDRDRPLADRGRGDAAALGLRLATDPPAMPGEALDLGPDVVNVRPSMGNGFLLERPEVALCSAAVRTRQTAELVLAPRQGAVHLDAYRSLYDAETSTVLTYLREIDQEAGSALLVGHNPTMAELVYDLQVEGAPGRRLIETKGFPTCALAVLRLEIDAWGDVVPGCGTLVGLYRPPY